MIFTSYFGNIRNIPDDYFPIAICAKAPEYYSGAQYKTVAPSYSILMDYKKDKNTEIYTKRYYAEVLGYYRPEQIVKHLYEISGGKTPVLLCYEKPTDFCHRHLLADWLSDAGYDCMELR